MLPDLSQISVKFYSKSVDMRKSIDGLSLLVSSTLLDNPVSGNLYVFYNKKLDKLKILYWDNNGFCLYYKRLEKCKFILTPLTSPAITITINQLKWLLDGLDISKIKPHEKPSYKLYY